MMQITNVRYHDNGSPQAGAARFHPPLQRRQRLDRRHQAALRHDHRVLRPRPRSSPPTRCRRCAATGPTGGISAPAAPRTRRRRRCAASATSTRRSRLEAWHPGEQPRRRAMLHDTARDGLALYAEHTWGADRSISHPYSPETRTQQLLKLATAAEGASVARMLRRDGLEQLAIDAGGDEPRLLVFNPHPFPVDAVAAPALPAADGRRARSAARLRPRGPRAAPAPSSHRIQRQDVVMSDLSRRARLLDRADRRARRCPTSPCRPPSVRAGRYRHALAPRTACCPTAASPLTLDRESGGVTSLQARRRRICRRRGRGPDVRRAGAGAHRLRHPHRHVRPWSSSSRPTGTRPGTPTGRPSATCRHASPATSAAVERGSAEHQRRRFDLANGDKVEVIYRLLPDDPALQIEAIVTKQPLAEPHAIYLPMPTALGAGWDCRLRDRRRRR